MPEVTASPFRTCYKTFAREIIGCLVRPFSFLFCKFQSDLIRGSIMETLNSRHNPNIVINLRTDGHFVASRATDGAVVSVIPMQKGPVLPEGAQGLYIEDLIVMAAHRLNSYNQGKWRHPLNDTALTCLNNALASLSARASDRETRGVLNTDQE